VDISYLPASTKGGNAWRTIYNKYLYRYPIFLASNSCSRDRTVRLAGREYIKRRGVERSLSGRAAANPDFFRPPFLPKSCNVSAALHCPKIDDRKTRSLNYTSSSPDRTRMVIGEP
ncbi:hypothetical protein ALC56_11392, partial [Trachymyrmex septentrionalis]